MQSCDRDQVVCTYEMNLCDSEINVISLVDTLYVYFCSHIYLDNVVDLLSIQLVETYDNPQVFAGGYTM